MGSLVRNSYVSTLCPVVICPCLCTSDPGGGGGAAGSGGVAPAGLPREANSLNHLGLGARDLGAREN